MTQSATRPFWIGLTGGIASGKSAVATEFAALGVPVIDADLLARAVVQPGQPALQAIVTRFGPDMLDRNGQLDRPLMRERIFNSAADKQALEAILHPAIRLAQLQRSHAAGGAYQIHVMPLLVETGSESLYDRILVVDCPVELQRERLLRRDDISPALAEQMLAAQASRAQRLAVADDVVDNQGSLADLRAQVAVLHQRYLQLVNPVSPHTPRDTQD